MAVLEKVHGMPGMNVSAVSSFMRNVGHIEMALIALDIPFTEVTPQTWMKFYNLKREKDESKPNWKRRLREHLQRIMPDFKVTNDNEMLCYWQTTAWKGIRYETDSIDSIHSSCNTNILRWRRKQSVRFSLNRGTYLRY